MSDVPPHLAHTVRRIRLFRLAAAILVALVGVVALVIGGVLTASRSWPSATGTVESCTAAAAPGPGRTTSRQRCTVSWLDGDRRRATDIELGRAQAVPGAAVTLRYRGDTAVVETPGWAGPVTAGVGLTLLATGAYLLVRARRQGRPAPHAD
ncbi:DUF3592 domain-containing protein [Phytohabitans kaempferiae]|uniref:DUF3592 domain-containing protein n=1 Tax=Phytohabitans kaempferiae TaxID=1620943 RepID=A0ABV6MHI5_9ACTN